MGRVMHGFAKLVPLREALWDHDEIMTITPPFAKEIERK